MKYCPCFVYRALRAGGGWPFACERIRVVDGDTIECDIHLALEMWLVKQRSGCTASRRLRRRNRLGGGQGRVGGWRPRSTECSSSSGRGTDRRHIAHHHEKTSMLFGPIRTREGVPMIIPSKLWRHPHRRFTDPDRNDGRLMVRRLDAWCRQKYPTARVLGEEYMAGPITPGTPGIAIRVARLVARG